MRCPMKSTCTNKQGPGRVRKLLRIASCALLRRSAVHSVLTLGGGGVALLAGELCRGSQFPVYTILRTR